MYLKKLELQGFKSFADKTTIDFERGITGVVGPNGSGKSNISDAIRWVLGEQKVKTLRGSKMEDVIFAGTSKRKPLGFSEVTLVLDNKNKKIPIDYSEVSVTRRVYRSGESEYYINKSSARLKDVKELFMDTGIGTDGYSIIGQGKIEEILSSKAEDRRNLIEEAVGIVKYKSRKKESEKKLDKTKENLIRINDIIEELSKNIDSLKEQSEKANEYISLKERLKKVEVNLFIREIRQKKNDIKHLNHQKEVVLEEYSSIKETQNKIEDEFQKTKKLIEETDIIIEETQNKKQSIQKDIEKKEIDLKINNEKISFLNREIIRLDLELESNIELVEEKKDELLELKNKKNDIDNQIKDLNLRLDNIKESLKINESNIKFSEENIEKKKSTIIDILNNITEKKGKINTIESFNKNMNKREKDILEEKNELIIRKESIKNETISISEEIDYLKEELKININKKDNILNNKEMNQEKLEKYSDNINKLSASIDSNISRFKMLNNTKERYEGYYKGVKNILLATKKDNQFGSGLKGVVAELIETEEKYEKAIEIALGGALQNIVTESKEDAKRFIDYLKKNKLGRVTFLPLESIKARNNHTNLENLLSEDGVYGIASSLIKFDDVYKDIFEYLLGRIILIKDLNTGISISRKFKNSFKLVTLEGDVINTSGSMTGGDYKNNNSTSLIGRDREIEDLKDQINSLKEKHENMILKHSQFKKEIIKGEKELEKLNEYINTLKIDINNKENKNYNLNEQSREIENRVSRHLKELNNIKEENKNSENRVNKIKEEIRELENKNNLTKENVEIDFKKHNKEKEKITQLSNLITKLKISLTSLEGNKKEILNTIKRLELEINSANEKEDTIKEDIKIKEKDIKNTEKLLDSIDIGKINLETKLTKCNSELVESKNKKRLYLNSFYKEQENSKEVNENISQIQKSLNAIDVKITKSETSLENYNHKLWDEYEFTLEMALEFEEEIENLIKVQSQIKEYKRKIKSLGNINLDSIEEYKDISNRYEFLTGQKEDLKNAKKSLEKVIKDMEVKMEDLFLEKFKIIKQNFKEVFEKLFGGGKTDIFLVDKEDVLASDIEIIAQPPGKKLQNINLLSGGEKSLTAISLLFAILKLKPTPFCVLDEIEAALDDANVVRFSEYLREFADKTQFIVITHRKGTMETVDSLYGVTMEENGISKLLSVKLSDLLKEKAS
ncbi:chromosome segregation protein SMC [Senegalia sp. (in: firmicutes)]|uniref:chromosome segregation protein SMC n=1 Tax=Senegalia sp. (in: firmicutes) TaxID=1924098 RepID=UPI003F9A5FF9